jgi:MFS family permease
MIILFFKARHDCSIPGKRTNIAFVHERARMRWLTNRTPTPGKKMASLSTATPASHINAYKIAWGTALIFYFLEYVVRSAPAVMIPELTTAFSVDAVGVSAIIGAYYYTYSVTSLVAGATLDRFGAKAPTALGAVLLGIGCFLFVVSIPSVGYLGRLLQGAGSAFAFTGAVFLATHGFSGSVLATAIGFTQCFGMLGGSAGQFGVGSLIHGALDWTVSG